MSDDVPQPPSNNPFIKFKRHVDSRIGAGLSVLTGTSSTTDSATTGASKPLENMEGAPNHPASTPSALPSIARLNTREHKLFFDYWLEWAAYSPYSPYNLRYLPNPVPAGVSSKDARLFDFGDAFEDLLAVSSGRELMDLRKQADRKRSMLDIFQFGETPLHWVRYLASKNLLPQPLPVHHQTDSPQTLAAEAGWWGQGGHQSEIIKIIQAQQQGLKNATNSQEQAPDWERLTESWINKLDKNITFNPANVLRGIEEAWGSFDEWKEETEEHWQRHKERMLKELDKNVTFNFGKMIAEAEQTVKRLHDLTESSEDQRLKASEEKKMKKADKSKAYKPAKDDDLNDFDFDAFLHDVEGVRGSENADKTENRQDHEPETEEDFFSAISDALEEVEKALTTKPSAETFHQDQARRSNEPVEVVQCDENGGKTYMTSTEHVDVFGHRHQKTEIRKVDANGNEISYETKYVIRPVSAVVTELQKSKGEREKESPDRSQDGKSNKSIGWFWR